MLESTHLFDLDLRTGMPRQNTFHIEIQISFLPLARTISLPHLRNPCHSSWPEKDKVNICLVLFLFFNRWNFLQLWFENDVLPFTPRCPKQKLGSPRRSVWFLIGNTLTSSNTLKYLKNKLVTWLTENIMYYKTSDGPSYTAWRKFFYYIKKETFFLIRRIYRWRKEVYYKK